MAIAPCSVCSTRFVGRAVTIYWAWYQPEGDRIAFRERTCPDDAVDVLNHIAVAMKEHGNELDNCPLCGTKYEGVPNPIYITVYLPEMPPKRIDVPCCDNCHASLTASAQQRGDLQPNRAGYGPPTQAPTVNGEANARLQALGGLIGGP
jgi:hypothetical protein